MKRHKRLLFVARYPMHYVMFRPLHQRLKAGGDFKVSVFASFKSEANPRALAAELGLERMDLIGNFRRKASRFDCVIAADYFAWDARGAPKVQIFHGCSFKNAAIHAKALEWDHLFTVGSYMRDGFVRAGLLGDDDPRLHLVGMPKVDRLAVPTAPGCRLDLLAAHGLDPDKPTLLYAPTCHEHESSLGTFGPALVTELAGCGRYNLLVKLHDHSLDRRYNDRDWRAWRDQACAAPGIAAFTGRDVTDALLATDLLISDASSVAYEYAIRDRPIVFLETTIEREHSDLDTFGRKIGRTATTVEAAMAAITESLANPSALSSRRHELVAAIFHQPGHATDNALATLRTILD